MRRLAKIILCWSAVATAALAYFVWASANPRPNRAVVPQLTAQSTHVTRWVDRGLLHLAERAVEDDSRRPEASELAGNPAGNDPDASLEAGTGESEDPDPSAPLSEQRERIYRHLAFDLGTTEQQLAQIRAIADASLYFGEGNPVVTVHPMSRAECRKRRQSAPLARDDSRICGASNMVAIYDPIREEPGQAKLCMDQFEFPNLPCEYPIVWVRANEAAKICRVLDKRLCDAHEWEGACAGKVRSPGKDYESWVNRQLVELLHNQSRELVWATGIKPDARLCATGALKSPGCVDASWENCGSNSYPTGSFPRCISPFGVYDMHGNVAEHMNLPLQEGQLGARGGSGETEMKGSWFAFDEYHPHPDDCRWRAPSWHATPVESELSHYNYHLGFRCCKDLD